MKATGRVREVSPQADPVTRTFEVKVGLTDAPEAMRLGSTVVGPMLLDATPTTVRPMCTQRIWPIRTTRPAA